MERLLPKRLARRDPERSRPAVGVRKKGFSSTFPSRIDPFLARFLVDDASLVPTGIDSSSVMIHYKIVERGTYEKCNA
jgi:hypothetical protein